MDQRHLLETQRSQTASLRGLPHPPYQIHGRPSLSPLIASQLSHQSPSPMNTDRFPAPVFSGRIQQPLLACVGPISPHLLERQRELKDASIMQAKFAQQRAMLALQISPTPPHGMEDRVQYVPAIMPNMSPEDSLAQLRRLHQQVLSMPNQEPHLYEVPSSNRPREARREAPPQHDMLGFASKERQMMEKHLLSSKQLSTSEHERIAFYRDRLQQHSVPQGEPSFPVVSNRLTANRPTVFSHTDLAAQSMNFRLYQNPAAESTRMIQEMEKLREHERLTRHDQLIYQQKQLPSVSPRLSPQELSSRIHPNFRSRLHASYIANIDRPKEKTSTVRWEQNIGMPSHTKHLTEQCLPQIKHVKSLAYLNDVPNERVSKGIDKRDLLMKMMESRIKQELDRDDESCPSSHDMDAHSKGEKQSSAMTKVPSPPPPPPPTPSTLSAIVQRHFKEEDIDTSEEHSSLPQDLSSSSCPQSNSSGESKPSRKRPAACDSEANQTTKRSRGIGDIFKSRLAKYASIPSCSRTGTSDGTVSSSILPGGAQAACSVEQPLDLSVNASQKFDDAGQQESHKEFSVPLSKPLNPFPDMSLLGKLHFKLETPTISDIISHAVVASLEKPYPIAEVPNHVEQAKKVMSKHTARATSGTSQGEGKVVTDSDQDKGSASEEECQQQLIDLLSTQFAGSFRNFLVSLLSECKNESVLKTLAISKAGENVPIVMKEELERCNFKISQTIRTLLENGDERDKNNSMRVEGTSEARVENDTSPPCQVSTTTDIWHNSPPVSPEGELDSASKCATNVDETGSNQVTIREEISDRADRENVGDIQESKMPSIMKVESLAPLSENKQPNSCIPVLLENHLEDDPPLCIDVGIEVGESIATESVNDVQPENQIDKAKTDIELEEDAIDFLKFGNEEIDAEERNKATSEKDSSTILKDKAETPVVSACRVSSPGNTCSEDAMPSETQPSTYVSVESMSSKEGVTMSGLEREGNSSDSACEFRGGEHSVQVSADSRGSSDDMKIDEEEGHLLIAENDINEEDNRLLIAESEINEEESNLVIAESEINGEESHLLIAESATTQDNVPIGVGKDELALDEVSTNTAAIKANSIIGQNKPRHSLILPKQSNNPASSKPPITVVSAPISIGLPHLYQIKQVQTRQLIQIVPTQVTSTLVCTLAPPISNVPVSPSATMSMNSLISQPLVAPVLSSPSSPKTIVPLSLSQLVSTPNVDLLASPITSTPMGQSTATSAVSAASTVSLTDHVTSSPQSRESSPSLFSKNLNFRRFWKGYMLIPQSTPQEHTNSKKAFVLAYTVVYHSTHLPCVLRSTVPFVPPKILWKSLFPKVSFTDFNKTLSSCSILQRYMTVLEQAALQSNLTANGISSCKLVPLDELDNKFQEVEGKLGRGESSDCTQS